ncbi:MAG: tail fiber domain-containing protein [Candidatus Pedobacter colombiensis]|uniref:Tail fiber domain-containing protein n=1 Tax=Candidatus Pedobacter colombiensis TaxID=3121371 RepID=A0AAJ5WBA7_9SPHI|nr:tail fiber domain-containing protein [Pedobacter sp.]WEK21397.1 MAG: tail fiber domain-containing protein [Pedobacter sp.]
MNNLIFKGVLIGLLLSASSLTVSAQKIDEQELKVNIGKISNSTQQLKNLEPVTFKYDVNKYQYLKLPAGEQYGFMASNVQSEFPAMVYEVSSVYASGKNNSKIAKYSTVQTENLIPVLVAAIKEQQAEIELLKNEVKLLQTKIK